MRQQEDLASYVTARWPGLLRVLVLLGCPAGLAADVALDGLARASGSWRRSSRRGDVDVLVHAHLLEAWDRRRRTPWWEDDGAAAGLPPTAHEALDALPPARRAALVLVEAAGLRPEQAADAADVPASEVASALDLRPPGLPDLRLVEVPLVPPPAPSQVRERRAVLRRRARATGLRRAALAVPVVLAVALATWFLTRPAPPEPEVLGPVRAEPAQNPVEVAWYADGVLHLADAEVRLPSVAQLGAVADGAVYVDGRGRVVHVAADGQRTELGRSASGVRLVTSADEGWVAWRDERSGDLVLHDVAAGEELARLPGEDLEPVAVDEGRLYYNAGDGAHALEPGGASEPVAPARLLDARSGLLVLDGGTRAAPVVRPGTAGSLVLFDRAARLDDGATALLTRRLGGTGVGVLRLRDARTGAPLPSGLGPGEVALAAEFGAPGTVVYVVARVEDRLEADQFGRASFSGGLTLRTCEVRSGACEDAVRFRSTASLPLLAR